MKKNNTKKRLHKVKKVIVKRPPTKRQLRTKDLRMANSSFFKLSEMYDQLLSIYGGGLDRDLNIFGEQHDAAIKILDEAAKMRDEIISKNVSMKEQIDIFSKHKFSTNEDLEFAYLSLREDLDNLSKSYGASFSDVSMVSDMLDMSTLNDPLLHLHP